MKTKRYHAKYGAFAMPDKRRGCVLVIGMDEYRNQDSRDIYLLDEFESWDCRELVQRAFQFDEAHGAKDWIGDAQHGAIKGDLYELNEGRRKGIYPRTPRVIRDAYAQPYQYILSQLKRLRDTEHRQLVMDDDSLVLRYMAEIAPDEVAGLELGAYPAIEALAFSVTEARDLEKAEFEALLNRDEEDDSDYDWLGVKELL